MGRRRAGLALLVATLVALWWWAWPAMLPGSAAGLPPGPAVTRPTPSSPLLARPSAALAQTSAPPATAALAGATALAAPAAGLGPVGDVTPGDSAELASCRARAAATQAASRHATGTALPDEAEPQVDARRLADAWDATRQRLLGSADLRQQAAGWLMDRPDPRASPPSPVLSMPAPAPLVALALASADPVVLEWAVTVCAADPVQAACQGLSARAWAQAQADNLLAWLPLLGQQAQAQEEALQAMASARRVDSAWMRWVALVLAARPEGLAPPLRLDFDMRLVALAIATPLQTGWLALLQACRDEALSDARRRSQCGQIAQRLVERGRELMAVGIGQALGTRLGWPADRAQAHKALQQAAAVASLGWLLPPDLADCRAPLLEHHLLEMDRLGEVGLARQALQAASAAAPARAAPVRPP